MSVAFSNERAGGGRRGASAAGSALSMIELAMRNWMASSKPRDLSRSPDAAVTKTTAPNAGVTCKAAIFLRELLGALELHRRVSHSAHLDQKGGRLVGMNRAPCRLRSTQPGNELAALLIAFGAAAASPAHAEGCVAPTSAMQQVKLYFGSSVRGRPFVTEWSQFLASEVTPKFPGGLTVSDARGQWRSGDDPSLAKRDPRARHPLQG